MLNPLSMKSFHMITLELVPSSQSKWLMFMDQHNLNMNSLKERNAVSMPLTVILIMADMAMVVMVTVAEVEDEVDVVGAAIHSLPQLMALMYLILIILLPNRNGMHLVQDALLSSNYVKTGKDVALEEGVIRLAMGMEASNMIMSTVLLLLTAIIHLNKMTTLPLTLPQPTAVDAKDEVLAMVLIPTTTLDSLGHWQ